MNEHERALLSALGQTRTWRTWGDTLELMGQGGRLATFVAVYLR